MDSRRLAIGTAQIGSAYGIANQSGQVNFDEAVAILHCARAAGVDTLDTAIAYGDSEERLGKIGVDQWKVVSKLPAIPDSCTNTSVWVEDVVTGSLDRLNLKRLYGLLLHNPKQLLGGQGDALYGALVLLKEQGIVEKIGVSVYNPEEIDALWPRFKIDIVQSPLNIIDRRLLNSGWLSKLHMAGIEVHVRSIFLQGLLLMEKAKRPASFNYWGSLWENWHCWLGDQALTPLQACIGFVGAHPEIERVVVGVDSLKQLEEVISAIKLPAIVPPAELITENLDLVDPSRWHLE